MEEQALSPWEVVPGLRVPGAYGSFSRVAALATRLAGWRFKVAEPMPQKCVIVNAILTQWRRGRRSGNDFGLLPVAG